MAACGKPVLQYSGGADGGGGGADCEDCVQIVKTTKRVRVPCHRNTYKQYTVKVPRQVTSQVARTVNYTDMDNRTKQVPYTINRPEQRVRIDNQTYQVPVQKTVTKMVSETRKVPRTVFVDVTTQVPKQYTTTEMVTKTRQVKIPYTVNVPEQRFRTENYQVPVQRSKTVFDNVTKTVFDTQVRTRCEPRVTYVTKEIPVYNVVARPAQPCPPGCRCDRCGGGGQDNAALGSGASALVSDSIQQEFNSIDTNNDGMVSAHEYGVARAQPLGGGGSHSLGGGHAHMTRPATGPGGIQAYGAAALEHPSTAPTAALEHPSTGY